MSNKFNIKVKRTYCMHVVAATDRSLVVKVYFRSWNTVLFFCNKPELHARDVTKALKMFSYLVLVLTQDWILRWFTFSFVWKDFLDFLPFFWAFNNV